jgi:hypothetical protein
MVDIVDGTISRKAILKVFPKTDDARYTKEVNAYRLLHHFGVPATVIVPSIYGVLSTIDRKKLDSIIEDEEPIDARVVCPASLVVMEYIQGERPSVKNMNPKLAIRIVKALRKIQMAHIAQWYGGTEHYYLSINRKSRLDRFLLCGGQLLCQFRNRGAGVRYIISVSASCMIFSKFL